MPGPLDDLLPDLDAPEELLPLAPFRADPATEAAEAARLSQLDRLADRLRLLRQSAELLVETAEGIELEMAVLRGVVQLPPDPGADALRADPTLAAELHPLLRRAFRRDLMTERPIERTYFRSERPAPEPPSPASPDVEEPLQ